MDWTGSSCGGDGEEGEDGDGGGGDGQGEVGRGGVQEAGPEHREARLRAPVSLKDNFLCDLG